MCVCVLLSRIAGFQPGYLYGLIIGYVVSRELSRQEEGKAMAVATASMLAAAVVAWLALGPIQTSGAGEFVTTALSAAAATIVVAGLEGAVFAMLPLRFLPGERVFQWDRRWWIVLLGLGAFGFCHILLNPTNGYLADSTRTSFLTIAGLLVTFGLASVLFWGWFRFRPAGPTYVAATAPSSEPPTPPVPPPPPAGEPPSEH